MPGNATTLSDALAGIARAAIDDVAAAAATEGAEGAEVLRGLRGYDPAEAHQPARDLYERLRFAEHALAPCHPDLAGRLRRYGEAVERLL